jgi:hypothetical protein
MPKYQEMSGYSNYSHGKSLVTLKQVSTGKKQRYSPNFFNAGNIVKRKMLQNSEEKIRIGKNRIQFAGNCYPRC